MKEMLTKNKFIEENRISFTTDIWTSKHSKDSFLQISVQWIDDEYFLRNCSMLMQKFPMSHTSANISETV